MTSRASEMAAVRIEIAELAWQLDRAVRRAEALVDATYPSSPAEEKAEATMLRNALEALRVADNPAPEEEAPEVIAQCIGCPHPPHVGLCGGLAPGSCVCVGGSITCLGCGHAAHLAGQCQVGLVYFRGAGATDERRCPCGSTGG